MFDNLSKKLLSVFDKIRSRGILTEDVIDATIREIRISLLEADVALSVVKDFIVPKDLIAKSSPIGDIGINLKSYYNISM